MNDAKFTCLRRVTTFCSSAALILIIQIAVATITAAQTNVFVPGNASGFFGNPTDIRVPLVSAITVNGPATITVTYVSGTVNWGGGDVGPDGGGVCSPCGDNQSPLYEALGAGLGKVTKIGALIGVFVPQARVQYTGFNPLDGTKNITRVGILPSGLFFIGTGKTFSVSGAGTLFLGINDYIVGDNSGGFNVTVSAQ